MKNLFELLTMPAVVCGLAVHILVVMLLTEAAADDTSTWLRVLDGLFAGGVFVDYWTCWRKRLK